MAAAADTEHQQPTGRILSYTEISAALDCQARWDFSYGGHLAGDALRPKQIAPQLQGGRAWGAAVARLHAPEHEQLLSPMEQAVEALDSSLEHDAAKLNEFGLYDPEAASELRDGLVVRLHHYEQLARPLVTMDPVLERELLVPLPSRSGNRSSSRYKLIAYLDATRLTQSNELWLVEFKLRGTLTDATLIAKSRQIRWYAWAYWRMTGRKPRGVEVIERLNEAPKPARIVNAKRKADPNIDGKTVSHAVDQMCTPEDYESACEQYGVDPHAETLDALRARRWQQVVPIMFRDGELEEAGRELVSAAKLIHYLDTGDLTPLRNAKRANCGWCPFKEICADPDPDLVDALFSRTTPKRFPRQEGSENGNAAAVIAAGQQRL